MKKLLILIFILILVNSIHAQSAWPDSSKYQGLHLVNREGDFKVFISPEAKIDQITLDLIENAKCYFDQI